MTTHKWGALASFMLAVSFIVPGLIYFATPYPAGRVWYQVADFLSGPLWAATLVAAFIALRDRIGERAPRRMSLAQLAATFAAAFLISAAILRSANRDYLELRFPEPELMSSVSDRITRIAIFQTVSVINPALTAAGWHFLGWALLILGSATWNTRDFPRVLTAIYLVSGVLSLFMYLGIVYINANGPAEAVYGIAALLCVIWAVWQGIFLWTTGAGKPPALIETQQPA